MQPIRCVHCESAHLSDVLQNQALRRYAQRDIWRGLTHRYHGLNANLFLQYDVAHLHADDLNAHDLNAHE